MAKRKPKSGDVQSTQSRVIDKIQKELGMSDLEMEGIANFTLSASECTEIQDVLEKIIQDENLNIRQKVALSHTLGMFRTDRAATQDDCGAIVIEVPKF